MHGNLDKREYSEERQVRLLLGRRKITFYLDTQPQERHEEIAAWFMEMAREDYFIRKALISRDVQQKYKHLFPKDVCRAIEPATRVGKGSRSLGNEVVSPSPASQQSK